MSAERLQRRTASPIRSPAPSRTSSRCSDGVRCGWVRGGAARTGCWARRPYDSRIGRVAWQIAMQRRSVEHPYRACEQIGSQRRQAPSRYVSGAKSPSFFTHFCLTPPSPVTVPWWRNDRRGRTCGGFASPASVYPAGVRPGIEDPYPPAPRAPGEDCPPGLLERTVESV